ncbi:MAG: hypothetical protein WC333_00140 [Dehalococcoidia bacterium]
MKNLAGNKEADKSIKEELYLAGIEAIHVGGTVCSEVPYSIIGRIGYWTLTRAWYYWIATVERLEDGLPFEEALKLHNTPNPVDKDGLLGHLIRVGGHCGCPSPAEYGARLADNGKRYVDGYHIDDQIGLNEFAKVLKEFYKTNAT